MAIMIAGATPADSFYPSETRGTKENETTLPTPTGFTVLRSANKRVATKRFHATGVEGYAREKFWRWEDAPVDGFASLAATLQRIERDPLAMVVLGAVAPGWRGKEIILRRKTGHDPSLVDARSRAIHFDVDGETLPAGTSWTDPETAAGAVWSAIGRRAPAFEGVACYWQASSSAAMPGKEHLAKFHFWALVDKPVDEVARRAILRLAGTDEAVAGIAQPQYVAAPIFAGVADPLAGRARSGIIPGAEAARLDEIAFPPPRQRARKLPRAEGGGVDLAALTHATTDAGRAILERLVAKITRATTGSRNATVNMIAFTVAGHVAGGSVGQADALEALYRAAHDAGATDAARAVQNGFRDGLRAPIAPPAKPPAKRAEPERIAPYHAAPRGARDAAIAAHPAAIRAWHAEAVRTMQAMKAVKAAYAELEHPEPGAPECRAKLRAIKREQNRIRRQVRDRFKLRHLPAATITAATPVPRLMVTGAQGVGKTSTLVGSGSAPGAMHDAVGLVQVMYQPTLAMADQARRDYDASAPPRAPASFTLRGRGAQDPAGVEGETMCALATVATALAVRGASVKKALCEVCPFADSCGYLRQEREIAALAQSPQGVAVFAAHDYAFLRMPGGIAPDIQVFDERPRDFAVEHATVDLEALGDSLQYDRPPGMTNKMSAAGDEVDAQAINLQFIRPLNIALRDAGRDHPHRLLAALRERGIDRDHIVKAMAGLRYFEERGTVAAMQTAVGQWRFARMNGRDTDLEARLQHVLEARATKITRALHTVFAALAAEIDKPRDQATGVYVETIKGDRKSRACITAARLRRLRAGRVPLLHLDGTGDHAMAKRVFGDDLEIAHHPVERTVSARGDHVVQVIGNSFHAAGIIGGHRAAGGKREAYSGAWAAHYDGQREDIRKIIAAHPGALVGASKQVLEALHPEALGARGAHFAEVRGRNDWQDCSTAIIVGADIPGPADVEAIARAYAANDLAAFTTVAPGERWPTCQRGIRMSDGTGRAVEIAFHPNAWGDRVLRQIRDASIEQTIDRLRPIFKATACRIVVLAPVVVDLTVDAVETWANYRQGGSRLLAALREHGVIPLQRFEAARLMPSIWTARTARDDLAVLNTAPGRVVELIWPFLKQNILFNKRPDKEWTLATYQTAAAPGKRARHFKALIAARADQARAVLEKITGSLQSFEVVDTFAPVAATHDPPVDQAEITTPDQVRPGKDRAPTPKTRQRVRPAPRAPPIGGVVAPLRRAAP